MKTDADQTLRSMLPRIYREVPVGLCCLDTKLRFVYINDRLAAINGRSIEEHLGRTIHEVIPGVAAGVVSQFRHVIETGEQIIDGTVIAETAAHPGVKRHFRHHYLPLKSDDGTVIGINCVVQDITDERRAEERYYDLYENAPDMFASIDAVTGKIVECNKLLAVATGYTKDELRALPHIRSLYHPDSEATRKEVFASFIAGRAVHDVEVQLMHKDGSKIDVSLNVSAIRDESGNVVLSRSVWRDISDRKRFERISREQGDRLRSILSATMDGIIAIDSAGIIELVNDSALRMFGYEESELLGKNVGALMPEQYSSEHDVYLQRYLQTGEAKVIGIGREIMCRRKDKTLFPADLAVTETDYRNRHIFIGTVRDISERKKIEASLVQRERELTHVARLSTMGEMAAGLAHELNQPLGAISNYAGNCLHLLETGDTPGLRADLLEIDRITKRCADIIQRIRRFVKRREPYRETVDIGQSINEVLSFVKRDARIGGVDVHYDSPQSPIYLFIDSVQLEQVFLNLTRNALEAMAESEREEKVLSIKIESRQNEVEISVRDTGDGIPPDMIERVSEPFISTKADGLGMGLSICRTIVEAHGGSLEIVSPPGCGTLVKVTVPNKKEAFGGY